MREPRYPLPRVIIVLSLGACRAPEDRAWHAHTLYRCSLALDAPGVCYCAKESTARDDPKARGWVGGVTSHPGDTPFPHMFERVRWSICFAGFDNDPSAGSPTETLLRLLLPLNDKVQ